MERARLERAEALACDDLYRAAPPDVARDHGIAVEDVDGALLMRVASLPGEHMFNRAMGLGREGADLAAQVAEVRRFFDGVPHVVSLDPDAPDGAADALAVRGYAPDDAWDKFARPAEPPAGVRTDLSVREAGPADARAVGAVSAAAFGLPAFTGDWLAALVGRPGWTLFLAEDGGRPVCAAGLFVEAGTAWLGFGGTLPEHRGRGAQGALFAARIRAAVDAGCTLLATETGAPAGRGPGPSYRNMLRLGFTPVYRRPNLLSPPAAAHSPAGG